MPDYEMDDGPLAASTIEEIRSIAAPLLPKGRVLESRSLLMGEEKQQDQLKISTP